MRGGRSLFAVDVVDVSLDDTVAVERIIVCRRGHLGLSLAVAGATGRCGCHGQSVSKLGVALSTALLRSYYILSEL